MIFALLLTLLYLAVLILTGLLASRWVLAPEEDHPAERWLAVSFGLGLGIHAACHLWSIALLGKITWWIFGAVVVVLAGVFAWGQAVGKGALLARYHGLDLLRGPANSRVRSLYLVGCALLLLFLAVLYENAMSYPMASYDGRAIWNYKAKVLFHEHTPLTEAFTDEHRVHYHRDYPLLVPLAEFGLYSFLGRIDEDIVRFVFSTLMAAFLCWIFFTVQGAAGRTTALFFTLIFAGLPFREYWEVTDGGAVNSGEADFPLAFFSCVSALSYWRWWREGRRGDLILGALFCGFALMTKKEGMIVFVLLAGVNGFQALFGAVPRRMRALGIIALANVLTLAVAAPWFLTVRGLPNHYDEDFLAMITLENAMRAHQRLPIIWEIFTRDVTDITKWSLAWFLYPILLVTVRWRAWLRRDFFLDAVILGWLAAYTVVYMFSPLNLVFHLNTSLRRLVSHIFPVLLIQIAFSWSDLAAWVKSSLKLPAEAPSNRTSRVAEPVSFQS